MTQEFLEKTDTAGNIIYTSKTGEKLNMEPVQEKNKDVVATMTFPAEQLIEMFKDYTMTGEAIEEMIASYDYDNVIESAIENIDWNDKVTDVLGDIDLEDYISTSSIVDSVMEAVDYGDIANEVKQHMEEPDAESMARDLLSQFSYESPCHTGKLYIESVESIIEGYMKKQLEGVIQPTTIVDNQVVLRSFTIQEINEVLDSLQYTEYNKSRILTSLSLK
ncbi:hypothetical protein UFOVP573_36 [uncultured Caudovirales phage]|uniref:Uncharacterized protein n=1 Tax=uncultured Caudovirales phage TaxID=2100421 RepID=A0A6J5R5W6_9CAUD|nr:hypothetical protein UFOVP288_79 [uncultured Caudovirales phage]CAB4146155.1 hypothetical protein UFOVP483_117 [uncultured Caudovirales phage]CAB4150778.1 hypothetical protein UFOVP573_36 [uncultured Caudovirales phage]CAB4161565.1 hypothetical protein UFOVP769_79 [uncultured Caudovirales phage]CAB4174410.1 hypothetical protein UFOVP962_47 [uncultured Caudovirales phage]